VDLTASRADAGRRTGITTVVCDYGGVLTNPLIETYTAFAQTSGLGLEVIARAFQDATRRHGGVTPMAALETAEITEEQFVERIAAELPADSWRLPEGVTFGELWFAGRTGNEEFVAFLRTLAARGYRLALLTNNVREWDRLWRATIPVDELFDVVVNSAEERVRKPDPEIYRRLLERLDEPAEHCLFVDDLQENLDAAAKFGMETVLFTDTRRTVEEVSARLGLEAAE